MPHINGFEFQPTKNLNRFLREYGQACLSDATPAAPGGNVNVSWQTDSLGNMSAYVPEANGFIPMGAYSPSTSYDINDLVLYEGSSYVSIVDNNINNTPSSSPSDWSLIAQGGSGVTPATVSQLGVYTSSGESIQGTGTSLTNSNQSNQWDLFFPGTLRLGYQNSLPVTLPSTTHYPSLSNYGYFQDYNILNSNVTLQGSGFNLGNNGGWTVGSGINNILGTGVRGIHQAYSYVLNKHSVGDNGGVYGYINTDGGVSAESDEGVTGTQSEIVENPGYYHGTVVSSIGVNDLAPVWSTATSGNNWTTDGAFMLNVSRPIVSSRVTTPTTVGDYVTFTVNGSPVTSYLYSFGCTASSIPISTAVGIQIIPNWSSSATYNFHEVVLYTDGNYYQSNIVNNTNQNPATSGNWFNQGTSANSIPAPQCTADSPISQSFTIQLATFNGATNTFSVGDHISVAGSNYGEQSIITAVTTSGFTQRITCLLRNSNSKITIFKGGIAGGYISSAANLAFSGMRSSYYAFGSLDGTNLIYGLQVAGRMDSNTLPQLGNEQWTADGTANSEFTVYPGAEIVSNPNFFSPAGHIEQNNVPWTAGDSVENPHYPAFGGTAAWFSKVQNTPTNPEHGSIGLYIACEGYGWGGGGTSTIWALNANPSSYYLNGGGTSNLIAPLMCNLGGPYSTGLAFSSAPQAGIGSLIKIQNSFDGGATKPDVNVINFDYSEWGNLFFSHTNGYWQFGANLVANNFVSDQGGVLYTGTSGTFTSSDGKTVTVTGGIITSIVA
jgi:hypothetical protein